MIVLLAGCAQARADEPVGQLDGRAVLQKRCARCHTGARAEGDLDFITDTPRLIAEGLVIPGDAARSLVFHRVEAGEMPPDTVKARPSAAEIEALRAWIDGLPTTVAFRRERDVGLVLAADAARLPADARPFARWFTLAHLANAGVPEPQLERYRVALATLLGSLTWSPVVPAVVAIDRERTIFRIDLRELGWAPATWDRLRASYPYGVARSAGVPDSIRADWFVATASRPPLYHDLLGLPQSDAELARRLGVDLADDLATGRVARAGFNHSGVSVNNRVIERHVTRHGALWRSYDFASSIGLENIFTHPLAFVPAGGEIIFNLPDGFQGYMLVDRRGRRIDKAPLAIVSDPRRPDRAVENGISCMGCHASGIIARGDQIRDTVGNLDVGERDRVRRLYPPAAAMAAWFAQDGARFAAALTKLGVASPPDPSDEPISLLTGRYEADLDLRLAAAELGLRPDELAARLARSSSLRQTFGALAQPGGTVKRDTWSVLFPRAVDELSLAIAFTPRTSDDRSPAVWIDARHDTWVVLGDPGGRIVRVDQATALAQCRARHLELPRTDELVTAIANGLAAGLQQDQPLWTAGVRLDASNQRYGSVVDPFTGAARRADVAEAHTVVCVQR
ncbi:MAG: domain, G-beta repeat [Deltaproteobacteria bacterium]|nr:domain, G-beta repeat [Deltaproteobacteria bacterium]